LHSGAAGGNRAATRRGSTAAVADDLRAAGIPLAEPAAFEKAAARFADERRLLLALVEEEGWRWQERAEKVEPSA